MQKNATSSNDEFRRNIPTVLKTRYLKPFLRNRRSALRTYQLSNVLIAKKRLLLADNLTGSFRSFHPDVSVKKYLGIFQYLQKNYAYFTRCSTTRS